MKLNYLHILTIVFVILKLTDYIAWSWWWVLSPTLIPIGLEVIGFLIFAFFIRKVNK